MKIQIVTILICIAFLFSFLGCSGDISEHLTYESGDISEHLTYESGEKYLILPISKNKVLVYSDYEKYLDSIDIDLLNTAEEKLTAQISQYTNHSDFYLQIDEGYLCLYVEVIVDIENSSTGEYEEHGCGIDHEHKFFGERISK